MNEYELWGGRSSQLDQSYIDQMVSSLQNYASTVPGRTVRADPSFLTYLAEAIFSGKMSVGHATALLTQNVTAKPSQPQPKENTSMIRVADVTLSTRTKYGRSFGGTSSPKEIPQETAAIFLGMDGVTLNMRVDDADDEADKTLSLTMPPEKAVLLAQAIMKAAESQIEYAAKAKELAEERAKLDETFKERISGLALTGPTAEDMLVVSRTER